MTARGLGQPHKLLLKLMLPPVLMICPEELLFGQHRMVRLLLKSEYELNIPVKWELAQLTHNGFCKSVVPQIQFV